MFSKYKKKIKSRIDERVNEYCYHDLQKVTVLPAEGGGKKSSHTAPYNYRCYWNACDYAYNHKNYDVVMGMHRNNRTRHVSLHFWVRHQKTCVYYDPSLGYMTRYTRYWEIKTIPTSDWGIIDDVFSDALDYYKEKITTPWERFIIGGERIV